MVKREHSVTQSSGEVMPDFAFVAQGIEHRPSNPGVVGSIPTGGAWRYSVEMKSEHEPRHVEESS